jgi:hypothetical protein
LVGALLAWSDAPASYSSAMKSSCTPTHELPSSVEIHSDPKQFFGVVLLHSLVVVATSTLLLWQVLLCNDGEFKSLLILEDFIFLLEVYPSLYIWKL